MSITLKVKFLKKNNNAGDARRSQSPFVMKEFLDVKKIVSKEQSFQQELIGATVTKSAKSELQETNQKTLSSESSNENQVAHKNSASQNEEAIWQTVLGEEIKTDISECVSVVSKDNDSSYGDKSSIKRCNVLEKLGKSFQSNDLEKSQSINENLEPTSVYGLSINIFILLLIFS